LNIKILIVTAAMGVGWLAHAEVPQRAEAKQILAKYRASGADSADAASENAAEISNNTRICGYCHGPDGNSIHPEIPSLAGQNPQYVIEQLLLYKLKIRQYPAIMHDYAQKMSPETMAAVALHFAALPRRPLGNVDATKAAAGAALYKGFCSNCHGEDGKGANDGYAAINAQSPAYIALTLKRFRDIAQERTNHVMRIAARGMTDGEIESLAHYIAGL